MATPRRPQPPTGLQPSLSAQLQPTALHSARASAIIKKSSSIVGDPSRFELRAPSPLETIPTPSCALPASLPTNQQKATPTIITALPGKRPHHLPGTTIRISPKRASRLDSPPSLAGTLRGGVGIRSGPGGAMTSSLAGTHRTDGLAGGGDGSPASTTATLASPPTTTQKDRSSVSNLFKQSAIDQEEVMKWAKRRFQKSKKNTNWAPQRPPTPEVTAMPKTVANSRDVEVERAKGIYKRFTTWQLERLIQKDPKRAEDAKARRKQKRRERRAEEALLKRNEPPPFEAPKGSPRMHSPFGEDDDDDRTSRSSKDEGDERRKESNNEDDDDNRPYGAPANSSSPHYANESNNPFVGDPTSISALVETNIAGIDDSDTSDDDPKDEFPLQNIPAVNQIFMEKLFARDLWKHVGASDLRVRFCKRGGSYKDEEFKTLGFASEYLERSCGGVALKAEEEASGAGSASGEAMAKSLLFDGEASASASQSPPTSPRRVPKPAPPAQQQHASSVSHHGASSSMAMSMNHNHNEKAMNEKAMGGGLDQSFSPASTRDRETLLFRLTQPEEVVDGVARRSMSPTSRSGRRGGGKQKRENRRVPTPFTVHCTLMEVRADHLATQASEKARLPSSLTEVARRNIQNALATEKRKKDGGEVKVLSQWLEESETLPKSAEQQATEMDNAHFSGTLMTTTDLVALNAHYKHKQQTRKERAENREADGGRNDNSKRNKSPRGGSPIPSAAVGKSSSQLHPRLSSESISIARDIAASDEDFRRMSGYRSQNTTQRLLGSMRQFEDIKTRSNDFFRFVDQHPRFRDMLKEEAKRLYANDADEVERWNDDRERTYAMRYRHTNVFASQKETTWIKADARIRESIAQALEEEFAIERRRLQIEFFQKFKEAIVKKFTDRVSLASAAAAAVVAEASMTVSNESYVASATSPEAPSSFPTPPPKSVSFDPTLAGTHKQLQGATIESKETGTGSDGEAVLPLVPSNTRSPTTEADGGYAEVSRLSAEGTKLLNKLEEAMTRDRAGFGPADMERITLHISSDCYFLDDVISIVYSLGRALNLPESCWLDHVLVQTQFLVAKKEVVLPEEGEVDVNAQWVLQMRPQDVGPHALLFAVDQKRWLSLTKDQARFLLSTVSMEKQVQAVLKCQNWNRIHSDFKHHVITSLYNNVTSTENQSLAPGVVATQQSQLLANNTSMASATNNNNVSASLNLHGSGVPVVLDAEDYERFRAIVSRLKASMSTSAGGGS